MTVVTMMSAQTTNGSGSAKVSLQSRRWNLIHRGTWDGATITYKTSHDATNYVAIPSGAVTADGSLMVESCDDGDLDAVISGAGASTSLTVTASPDMGGGD